MKRFTLKKKIVAGVATAALVAGGTAAFAFFTSSATGSGSATVGSAAATTISPVTITGTLYPGGAAASVSFTINNPTPGTQNYGQVVIDPAFGGGTGITNVTGNCLPGDFVYTPSATTSYTIAAGGTAVDATSTLSLSNTAVSQDDCQGASPVLHLKTT